MRCLSFMWWEGCGFQEARKMLRASVRALRGRERGACLRQPGQGPGSWETVMWWRRWWGLLFVPLWCGPDLKPPSTPHPGRSIGFSSVNQRITVRKETTGTSEIPLTGPHLRSLPCKASKTKCEPFISRGRKEWGRDTTHQ